MDIDLIAKDLAQRAAAMAAGAEISAKDNNHPETDAALRQFLHTGSQLMTSCSTLSHGPHELAVNILLRSLIEIAIKAHWSTMSSGNAQVLMGATKEQLKTLLRINAKKGLGKILDTSGNDHTEAFLSSGRFDKGARLPSMDMMAEQCGLSDLYNIFYRFQSLHTHGNDVGEDSPSTQARTLCAVGAFSNLLGHVGIRWLVHRGRPDHEEIRAVLGLESERRPWDPPNAAPPFDTGESHQNSSDTL